MSLVMGLTSVVWLRYYSLEFLAGVVYAILKEIAMSRADRLFEAFRSAFKEAKDIPDADKDKLVNDLEHAYQNEPPPTIAIIGETGMGKTTTLNSLFNAGAQVGHSAPTTKSSEVFQLQIFDHQGNKGIIRVIDFPGLGESTQRADEILDIYRRNLPSADVILWVHSASDRMLQFVQQQISKIFSYSDMQGLLPRVVFGLNKADSIQPSNWRMHANIPSEAQLRNLAKAEQNFVEVISTVFPKDYTLRVVTYSALRRYQLFLLFRLLMDAMPSTRKWVLERRMDIADFKEFVDPRLLSAATGQQSSKSTPQRIPDLAIIVDTMAEEDLRYAALNKLTPEEWWERRNR
jgi:uncharacterized protein ykfA